VPAHEQFERAFGRFEGPAAVLLLDHLVEDGLLHRRVREAGEARGQLGLHVRAAGQLGDEDAALVADRFGGDVLV